MRASYDHRSKHSAFLFLSSCLSFSLSVPDSICSSFSFCLYHSFPLIHTSDCISDCLPVCPYCSSFLYVFLLWMCLCIGAPASRPFLTYVSLSLRHSDFLCLSIRLSVCLSFVVLTFILPTFHF